MKKLKKSMKLIISLVCVFLVAVAAVVTVVLVTQKRDDLPDDPTPAVYALTDAQKKLVDEINQKNSTLISSAKLDAVKIDTSNLPASVETLNYFDDSIAWSGSSGSYIVYVNVYNESTETYVWKTLTEVLQEKGIITTTPNLENMDVHKNHIIFANKIDENNSDWYVLTIKNHNVTIEKQLKWSTDASLNTYHKLEIGDDFFVNLEKVGTKSVFKFYLYGSNAVKYSYEIDNYSDRFDYIIINNSFEYVETVLVEYLNGQFSAVNNNANVIYYNLEKGSLVETRTEVNADNAKSHLTGGKYYIYSYKYVSENGTETNIDLGDYTKISSNYSSENYFELFFQKVDEHFLLSSGEMVYYDYNLTQILKYSAATPSSIIFYSDGTMVLTSEGFFAGKSTLELSKYSSLVEEDSNLSFGRSFTNGSFTLETTNDDFYIYNNKNQQVCNLTFDEIVYFIDDVNVILKKNGLFYSYNLTTNSYQNVKFSKISNLDGNAPLYLIEKDGNRTIYNGLNVFKTGFDDVIGYSNSLVKIQIGGTDEYYKLTEKSNSKLTQVSLPTSAAEDNEVELYDASSETWLNVNGTEYVEPEWYDYGDKVLYQNSGNDYTIKASHCITDGLYSGYSYFDFFEIAYNNSQYGGSYRPLRIYYKVTIGNTDSPHSPVLEIIDIGHISNIVRKMSITSIDGRESYKYKTIKEDGSTEDVYYYFGSVDKFSSSGIDGLVKNDFPTSNSYDYEINSSGNVTKHYAYKGTSVLKCKYDSTVEVYGNSIRVNLQFDIEQDSSYPLNLSKCRFGYTKLSGDVYYNGDADVTTLYKPNIDTYFSGLYDSSEFATWRENRENYYNKLYYQTVVIGINNYSTNYTQLTSNSDYIITNDNALSISTQNSNTALNLDNYNYYAYISDKNYLNKTSSVIKFGNKLQEKIVGAKIIGITTLNNTSYQLRNADLYSSGTYVDDMIEYRTYADGKENSDDVNLPKRYLTKGDDSYYTMQINNESSIYEDNGLNYFRFVFCIYAPETYYVKLDYNVSGDSNSIENEIDYLTNYAGLTIGQDGSVDKVSYGNTWAYALAKDSDEFKNTTIAAGKYHPNNFRDDSNRLSTSTTANNEYTAEVKTYTAKGEYYYYIIVDGIRYYFQRIFKSTTTHQDYISSSDVYLKAYRNIATLKGVTEGTFGNFSPITVNPETAYNENFYAEGDLEIIIKVNSENKTLVTYHKKTDHVRTTNYVGRFSYSGLTGDISDLEETTNTKYNVTETFSFLYSDPILFTSNPEHIHYNFVGWKVTTGDYAGKIINTSISDISKSSFTYLTQLVTLSNDNINPFADGTVNRYLAGSGEVYNKLWLLVNKSSADNPIVLQAVWEAKECTIDAVFYTVKDNDEGYTSYQGLKYDDTEGKIEDDLDLLTSGSQPTFYNIAKEGKTEINNSEGKVDTNKIKIKFKYSPSDTLNKIFTSYIELVDEKTGYSLKPSLVLSSDNLIIQFTSWAVENVNRSGTEPKYIPMSKEIYANADKTKIDQFIVDTTTLTIFAFYSAALYKFGTKIYPIGGATQDTTGKSHSSVDKSSLNYKNSDIYNDIQDYAKINMIVTAGAEGSIANRYANYESDATADYTQLSMVEDDFYYLRRFGNYKVGANINISIDEVNEKYFLSKIVFTNLTLTTNSNKKDKFTLTLTRKEDGNWQGTAVGQYSGATLSVSIDGSGNLTIGTRNTSDNVITLATSKTATNGVESHYSLTITNVSNPGNLDYASQLFGNDGTGFDVEFYFEAYTLKNETLSVEYVSDSSVDFDYNRLVMTSCQPLTNKEGKTLKTDGSEDAFVWFWSSKYLFAEDWTGSATSGYYLIYNSSIIPADYHEDFFYKDFIEQTLRANDSIIIYYDNETKMVYFPTQTESNLLIDGGSVKKLLSPLIWNGNFNSEWQQTYCYSYTTASGEDINYYLGEISYDDLVDNAIYLITKTDPTSTLNFSFKNENDVDISKLRDKPFSSGCEEFYVKVIKNKEYSWFWGDILRVYIVFVTPDDVGLSNDGLYTSAGNTRVIAFDPEQSRTYFLNSYSDETSDDYNFDLEFYISAVTIGTDTFTFDNIYSKFTKVDDGSCYKYNYLKMHCTNCSSYTTGEGRYIKYMGDYYMVNDVYMLNLTNTTNKKGATIYYFFITKSMNDNFVRYFLIYDIDKTSHNEKVTVSDVSYDIKFKIDTFDKELKINVTEEDVYDATAMTEGMNNNYWSDGLSLKVNYKKTAMEYNAYNFKNKTETLGISSFAYNYNSKFNEDTAENFKFYQKSYTTSSGSTIDPSDTLLKDYTNKNLINSITWSSLTKFYPSSSTKYAISANDGYIIKKITISLGYFDYATSNDEKFAKLISFEIDDSFSFEELFYNSSYSYTTGNELNVQSKIRYKIAGVDDGTGTTSYGLKIITDNTDAVNGKGLLFSNNASTAWSAKQSDTYTLDQIFLLISGIYNNVVIDVTTTSYTEFMFENGDGSGEINPLMKSEKYSELSEVSGQAYANISSLADTYLTFCAKKKDYSINTDNIAANKYILRYYLADTANGIKEGTIRLIFLGTGSLLKYGFDVLATTKDHSVYFTNGRYYNETAVDNNNNAFRRLTTYSGRTSDDEVIVKATRSMKDKLVYMGYGNSSNKCLTEYYKIYTSAYAYTTYKNSFETANKYFLVTEVHTNNIAVETNSYLYNSNLSQTTDKDSTRTGSIPNYNSISNLYYNFFEDNGKSRLYIGNEGIFNIYQLDNTSKQQSWFNDTVLTNLEYNYYGGSKNWVNYTDGVSELAKVQMHGLNFNWTYYEIIGYYLQYIMIEIADIGKFYIKEINNISTNPSEPTIIEITSGSGIKFKFKILYTEDTTYGNYYTLYPYAEDTFTNKTLFDYVALMSNNIKVSFVSMAENYKICYNCYISDKISTIDQRYTKGHNQSIYYDNMTILKSNSSMPGYTFVGWGSEYYFDGNEFKLRFTEGDETTPSTWNTSSSWYDPTTYFVQPGKTGQYSAKLLYDYYNNYKSGYSSLPGSAFYTSGGYFMTDTGSKSQNYNFFANYVTHFGCRYFNGYTSTNNIYLYAIFKANTYLIQFDVNSASNETTYLDYNSLGSFDCEFENNNTAFRVKNATTTISFYVTFDTSNWYFISGSQNLMYSYKSENGLPYITGDVVNSSKLSTVVTDKFGYSWLGWWYKNYTPINEGSTIENTNQVVFGSSYLDKNSSSYSPSLIKFNKDFYKTLDDNDSISDGSFTKQAFVYNNQHLSPGSPLGTNGYVYFYDYSDSGVGNSNKKISICRVKQGDRIVDLEHSYIIVSDYLNAFETSTSNGITIPYYAQSSRNVNLLSYYDTCYGSGCYKINRNGNDGNYTYSLQLDKSDLSKLRIIKLYANWVNNEYTVIFDSLDTNGKAEKTGSSTADFTFTSNDKTFFFNSTALQDYLLGKENELPSRIGYDFVGWSFSHIKTSGYYASKYSSLVSSVNSASKNLYLCSDLLSEYTILSGLEGTSNLESNILMIKNDRLSSVDNEWILNAEGTAEHLGDTETGTRYVYIFPVWKVQSFSITISLNIGKENLKNLFEKDSSFALGLYESSNPRTDKTYSGISSKNYTFNTTKASEITDNSYYKNYYNDIVANICFEIDFDQEFSEARLTIGSKTYKLKDLFATSAGYYFLGLMYENSGDNYIVQNTLNSVFTLSGLKHDNSSGKVEYKNIGTTNKLDINSYEVLHRSYYNKGNAAVDDYHHYDYLSNLNSGTQSTNFGFINSKIYLYDNKNTYSEIQRLCIMSELSGEQYYLYVLHNNVKYYVVYYVDDGGYKDCITFDRTFLYYNEIVNDEVVAKYIIRFDSNKKAYYVDDTFNKAHYINLKIAMYLSARNKLYTSLSKGIISWSAAEPDGNILKINGTNYQLLTKAFANSSATVTLTNKTTREFTLYADWGIRQVETKVKNGNNSSTGSASKNKGLAGYYEITTGGSTESSANDYQSFITSYLINFYSNVGYNFLPYYNGRYLSEMTFEFNTFEENTNSGATSFSMVKNTLVLSFEWKNSDSIADHTISISKITLNGSSLAPSTTLTKSTNTDSKYVNNMFNIDLLSMIDAYSMSNTTSALKLYSYETSNSYFDGRTDYNKVTLALTNLMCDLDITCKFSVQTFKVEVYNVEVESHPELISSGSYSGKYKTNFQNLASMQLQSNYNEYNQANLGIPYVSSINYNTTTMSTISTNCAANSTSYNVPYYFFITYSSLGTATEKDPGGYYGIDYLYDNGYYTNGTIAGTSISQENESLKTIANKITGENGVYTTLDGYWFEYYKEDSGVKLEKYNQTIPVRQNKVIYGTFVSNTASVKVFFYYWDNATNQYVHYTEIINDYTSGVTGNKLEEKTNTDGSKYYQISTLPSSNYSPWQNNTNFLGFIYLDSNILGNFTQQNLDEKYCGYEYSDSNVYINTSGEAYSAFYLNKVDYDKSLGNASYYYNTYIKDLSVIDLFKYKLEVVNNKYYTRKTTIKDGTFVKDETSILDAVRLNVGVEINDSNVVYIEKDFKMLNVETKLPQSGIIYAIPIYADISFKIKAANIEGSKVLNLTTNSNMLESVVFKINPKYTLFYDPRDIRIIISTSEQSLEGNRNEILSWIYNNLSNSNTFTIIPRGSSDDLNNSYGKYSCTPTRTSYIYFYYLDSGGVPVYYAENYLIVTYNRSSGTISYQLSDQTSSSTTPPSVEVETFVSPFEFELEGTYLAQYNSIVSEIVGAAGLSEAVKTNRKLIIYIALQLMQSGYVEIVNSNDYVTDNYFYSDTFSTSPKDSGGGNYSLTELIRIVNNNHVTNNNVKIYTTPVGFYRMVYSLARSFVIERTINGGNTVGLDALYGNNNSGDSALFGAINSTFGYTDTTGSHDIQTPYPGDLMADNISSEATLVYNYYNGETKTIYTTKQNVKVIMLLSCTYSSNTFKFSYFGTNGSGLEIKEFTFTFNGLSEYQANDKYNRFLLATGDLKELSGTSSSKIKGFAGYDNKEAYIVSGSQNYTLTLQYDGYNNDGTTSTREISKTYSNCTTYIYKEVGKTETKLIKMYDKFYLFSNVDTAQNNTISTLLSESRTYATNNYQSKMTDASYINDLKISKMSTVTNKEVSTSLLYTSTRMNVPSSNGTFSSNYAVKSRTAAKASGQYNYTFNSGIISHLTYYYGYQASYDSNKSTHYNTYLNKELQAYYTERYNEVKAQLDANSGSWYTSYIAWYKAKYWDESIQNYKYKDYAGLYESLLEEKKTAVINKYRGELADEYKAALTDEQVYDYILNNKSTYNFSAFRTAYINANLSTLTVDQIKLYFDRDNDGVVESSTTYYKLIRNAMADNYEDKTITDDDVYQYIYEHKDESTYSSLKAAMQTYYYNNLTTTQIKNYFNNTSDSTDIDWVKNIMATEYQSGLSDEQIYAYYIEKYDAAKFKAAIANNKFSEDYIEKYFDTDNNGVVDNDESTFNSIKEGIEGDEVTNKQVYQYIYYNQSSYGDLVSTIKEFMFDLIPESEKASYFKTDYSNDYNTAKAAMRTDKLSSYKDSDVYSYVLNNKSASSLSSLITNMKTYYYGNVTYNNIKSYCSNSSYSSTSAVTNAISSAKSSLRTIYYNEVTFDEVCTYYQGKQSSTNTIYSSSNTMTYKTLKGYIQGYLFDNEKGGVTKDLKVSYYAANYATQVENAKTAMRNEEYERLTASDVYNRKKSEAEVITEAEGNITKTEKDNLIVQQAEADTAEKTNYEELKADEYKEKMRTTAEETADSMVKYEAYLEAREKYLKDLAGKTKEKLALEYVNNNYATTFQNKLSSYATYTYSETSGTNYEYRSIVKSDGSIQCRVYMFKADIWYYNLTGSNYTYNKTVCTTNTGYDSGNIWIFDKDASGNIKNIYTRFSSFFG